MGKIRLDHLLVERGLAPTRSQAQRLVMAGQVRVDGQVALKPSTAVAQESAVEVISGPRYVSRGGEKLEAALDAFPVVVEDRVCVDVGASTGGFTDCLLQHGARRVYAIDVGQGILDLKLRQDPRVVVMEGTNARYVERLPELPDLATVDASFISLKVLLPVLAGWFKRDAEGQPAGEVVALIKPQFEVGRQAAAKGKGVVRDPALHRQVLVDVLSFALGHGWVVKGLIRSPLLGPKGNTEFLTYLVRPASEDEGTRTKEGLEALVSAALGEPPRL